MAKSNTVIPTFTENWQKSLQYFSASKDNYIWQSCYGSNATVITVNTVDCFWWENTPNVSWQPIYTFQKSL